MISYPNGTKRVAKERRKKTSIELHVSSANRGMDLEKDINLSNEYYRDHNLCLITKRPTPINVVKVDYSKGAIITHAYFEKQSTTDYNGVYKGKYIDFEAKSTKNKTSFPLANISLHQITHLENVLKNGGIAFFIIEFWSFAEIFLLDASYVIDFYKNNLRRSIPYETIQNKGYKIKRGFAPRLDYLPIIDMVYFK